jgi:hypothetical protein
MQPIPRIINATTLHVGDPGASDIYLAARSRIPGWTDYQTFAFFRAVLDELFRDPDAIPRILIAGVYHGLDLALIDGLAARYHPNRSYLLTGVDLFSSAPCADWPEEVRHLSWEEAFHCAPPSIEAARHNSPRSEIVQGDAAELLATSRRRSGVLWHDTPFHFVYLDTSHDEKSVRAEIAATVTTHMPGTVLAGDDYTGPGSFICGVAKAVDYMLPNHHVLFNRTWLTAL